jgi:hypothetical protein
MSLSERVLLAAYPARLRRRHGAELITTLTELTQGRPSRADRLHLVADGLRERFRLPVRQPLGVLTAVLAMLVGGAIGLAAGSWAGEQTYPSMPAAEATARQILGPAARPDRLERERFELGIAEWLGTPAGPADVQRRVGETHTRLDGTGWSVTPVERRGDQWSFWAQSGGLRVSVVGYSGPESAVEAVGYPVRPATYLPLVLGGLLAGLLAGWLVGAALAYRLRACVPAVVVAALGAVTLAVPAARLYQGLILFLGRDDGFGVGALVHDALAWMPWPLRDPTVFPDTTGPGLRALLAGSALIALAVVIAPRPGAGSGVPQSAAGE